MESLSKSSGSQSAFVLQIELVQLGVLYLFPDRNRKGGSDPYRYRGIWECNDWEWISFLRRYSCAEHTVLWKRAIGRGPSHLRSCLALFITIPSSRYVSVGLWVFKPCFWVASSFSSKNSLHPNPHPLFGTTPSFWSQILQGTLRSTEMCAPNDSDMIKMKFSTKGDLTSRDSFLNSYVCDEGGTMTYTIAILSPPEAPRGEESIIFRKDVSEHVFAEVTLREGKATSIIFLNPNGTNSKWIPVPKNEAWYGSIFPHPGLPYLTSNQQDIHGQASWWDHRTYLVLGHRRIRWWIIWPCEWPYLSVWLLGTDPTSAARQGKGWPAESCNLQHQSQFPRVHFPWNQPCTGWNWSPKFWSLSLLWNPLYLRQD